MSDAFDPYHKWLGISRDKRPPTHYRLLGIDPFEDDADVIFNSANRQMMLLRTFNISEFSDAAERLLNEVATAKVCLLSVDMKARYDAELRSKLPPAADSVESPRRKPPIPPPILLHAAPPADPDVEPSKAIGRDAHSDFPAAAPADEAFQANVDSGLANLFSQPAAMATAVADGKRWKGRRPSPATLAAAEVAPLGKKKKQPPYVFLAIGGAVLGVLLTALVWILTPPPPPPPMHGTLIVPLPDGQRKTLKIIIDDMALFPTEIPTSGSLRRANLQAGRHSLKIQRKGFQPVAQKFEIRDGETFSITPKWTPAALLVIEPHEGKRATSVVIDDERHAASESQPSKSKRLEFAVDSGEHSITIVWPTATSRVQRVVVALGQKQIISPLANKERVDNGLQMKLVWCPAGEFTMGSPHSERDRQHDGPEDQVAVTLTHDFWLGKYEVTQGQWKAVMGKEPWKGKDFVQEGANYAATFVSWNDAAEFCRKLTERERRKNRLPDNKEYALPTEAQWEYACRAGTTTRFFFGDNDASLSDHAWWGGFVGEGNTKEEKYAHQVGQKRANPWGLHDMHGNAWEWCRDWYSRELSGGTNPAGPAAAEFGVLRGGGWSASPAYLRSAYRSAIRPRDRVLDSHNGFRVALVPISRRPKK